jgi:putative colanic acid biosynthesis glycosyltransferase
MEPDASNAGAIAAAPRLSIVTVVKDDLAALEATLASTRALSGWDYEHWVIDGSRQPDVREALMRRGGVNWVSEPDEGIFHAMNKGLERARGDFVLFLNAGDVISSALDPAALFARLAVERRALIGHTIEVYQDLRWLRPGVKRAADVFSSPAHQATFYPRSFYAHNRYPEQLHFSADGAYTLRAIRECGAAYLPLVVCEFQLGGVSSNYQSARVLRRRMREVASLRQQGLLLLKFCLWRILPRRAFYSLLAAFKYTRLDRNRIPKLPADLLSPPAES